MVSSGQFRPTESRIEKPCATPRVQPAVQPSESGARNPVNRALNSIAFLVSNSRGKGEFGVPRELPREPGRHEFAPRSRSAYSYQTLRYPFLPRLYKVQVAIQGQLHD